MAYTAADLAALRAAIATGARRVREGANEVEYDSLDAMLRREALMVADLAAATAPRRSRFVRFGLDYGVTG